MVLAPSVDVTVELEIEPVIAKIADRRELLSRWIEHERPELQIDWLPRLDERQPEERNWTHLRPVVLAIRRVSVVEMELSAEPFVAGRDAQLRDDGVGLQPHPERCEEMVIAQLRPTADVE